MHVNDHVVWVLTQLFWKNNSDVIMSLMSFAYASSF